jgi:hydrogenase maturation protein HypF
MIAAQRIRVTGVVQGVGFRPFVWRLARELSLAGWVRNDSAGVEIAVEGPTAGVKAMVERIRLEAPPLARIDEIRTSALQPQGLKEFRIAESAANECTTMIGEDTGVCEACLAELFDPTNRRWRHPFITCTHCGPRYTIAFSLPYDRSRTSMGEFPLCPACAAEYENPENRRFHAEPVCCPACGPRLRLLDERGQAVEGDPIGATLERIRAGAIVAVKGLGGYHLVCDARNAQAVRRLRERKNREAKPLAVMGANSLSFAGIVELDAESRALLESPERPIVLAPKASHEDPLPGIAPGMAHFGVMLPATPIQWLLFHEAANRPAGTQWLRERQSLLLVMTSANPGGEPLVIGDEEALSRLAGIADAFLAHDRRIVGRCDDSVVIAGKQPCFVRRARGFTPRAIRLTDTSRPVLAVGAYLKNTVCATRGNEAFVSQHIGDLDDRNTIAFLEESVEWLCRMLEVQPALVVHDLHPEMPSTQLALEIAAKLSIPALAVQHHHAHVAAVLAEHRCCEPVLGVSLDGIGYGTDGGAWGGELLVVDGAGMRRIGSLAPLPLPGGDRAAREPWRMAAAVLHRLGRGKEIAERFARHAASSYLIQVLDRGVHSPPTSSMGRVFDAAAALLGICERSDYEAEAAMRLEAQARRVRIDDVPELYRLQADGVLDLMPLLARLAEGCSDTAYGAALFHAVASAAVAQWTVEAAAREGLQIVALSGGCFLNQLLLTRVTALLEQAGLYVLRPEALPPNDGAISVGQAWVGQRALLGGRI